jgi:hypothetical protein
MNHETKEYHVNRIEKKQLIISGKGNDPMWNKAVVLTDFCSPWSNEKQSEMEFKALWDYENFYFNFRVFDNIIHLNKKDDSIESIGSSDRVELFFRPDNTLNPYYCLEIDTSARIMDFIAYPIKNFDFDWNWPKNDLLVKSSVNNDFYTIEGAISIKSLNHFGLIKNNNIEAGVFRAKYHKKNNYLFEPIWMSWVNPNTQKPNFHCMDSFGNFVLKDDFV